MRMWRGGTDIGSVELLGISEVMESEGESDVGCGYCSGDGEELCASFQRDPIAAESAPGGSEADGPRANFLLSVLGLSSSAGEGFGVGTDVVELGVSTCCKGGVCEADLIKSAANRTLVGTRVRRMAPDDPEGDETSPAIAGCPPAISVQGEGRGFKGDIMEAEVESVGGAAFERPTGNDGGGILRRSMEEGLRNSDGRRWRGLGSVDIQGCKRTLS